MATRGEQTQQIMREEREATIRALDGMALSAQAREDVIRLWLGVQQLVNNHVGEQDRAIDHRVLPAVGRLMADEADRIYRRLVDAGLTPNAEA